MYVSLQWRHNVRDGVWNPQPHDCLLYRLLRRRSTKISKFRVTGLCEHKRPVTRKMFLFDDVIMLVAAASLWSGLAVYVYGRPYTRSNGFIVWEHWFFLVWFKPSYYTIFIGSFASEERHTETQYVNSHHHHAFFHNLSHPPNHPSKTLCFQETLFEKFIRNQNGFSIYHDNEKVGCVCLLIWVCFSCRISNI